MCGKSVILGIFFSLQLAALSAERLGYNNPEIKTTDLSVGLWAWPLPMDWDNDGDWDLIVACPDVPYRGAYYFENKNGVFEKAVKIPSKMRFNVQASYVDGKPRVMDFKYEYLDFIAKDFTKTKELKLPKIEVGKGMYRTRQWKYVDFNGDGKLDLSYGLGFWGEYGWDNAFDSNGNWTRGPLRGYVFILINKGTNSEPEYEKPFKLNAGGEAVDVFGMPSPNFSDFDGDGDLDLVCGEFMDGFTYFKNSGTRTNPVYEKGRYLTNNSKKIKMHIQMITPVALDWDKDGDIDLICGDEDGRVALIEHTGQFDSAGIPKFSNPQFLQQKPDHMKFGALVTPFSVDWDSDGDEDLICGNSAGNICFIENLSGGSKPVWAKPQILKSAGEVIHIQAGKNGSIQGPAEAKWGYTTLNVADWDQDGLNDIIVNSIFGKIIWYKNIGSKTKPVLSKPQSVTVKWESSVPKPSWNWWNPGKDELSTQWRTTPCIIDWNKDGLNDLVMLDHEGYLAFFEKIKDGETYTLLPGKRIFKGGVFNNKQGKDKNFKLTDTLRLNNGQAGASGRRKLCFADWDGDGKVDLLVNSVNINFLRNMGTVDGITTFEDQGTVTDHKLAGHTTSPTVVDWNKDGIPDLVIGAEDGFFYFVPNPRSKTK